MAGWRGDMAGGPHGDGSIREKHKQEVGEICEIDRNCTAFEPCSTCGITPYIYEIYHCTAFGQCSARGITPSSLLVCGEQESK